MTNQSQMGGPAASQAQPRRTRAVRFREIRDAILANSSRMMPTIGQRPTGRVMRCGPFKIALYPPGAWGPCAWSLNIWPGGKIDRGLRVHQHKVVNVFWDQRDNIDIWTFRSGPWEGELLSLLRNEGNIRAFG